MSLTHLRYSCRPLPCPALPLGSFLPFESWVEARATFLTMSCPHCPGCQASREPGLCGSSPAWDVHHRLPPCHHPFLPPCPPPSSSAHWPLPAGTQQFRPVPWDLVEPGRHWAEVGWCGKCSVWDPTPTPPPPRTPGWACSKLPECRGQSCCVEPAPGLRPGLCLPEGPFVSGVCERLGLGAAGTVLGTHWWAPGQQQPSREPNQAEPQVAGCCTAASIWDTCLQGSSGAIFLRPVLGSKGCGLCATPGRRGMCMCLRACACACIFSCVCCE